MYASLGLNELKKQECALKMYIIIWKLSSMGDKTSKLFDAYMRRLPRSPWVQAMAYPLLGAIRLPEPIWYWLIIERVIRHTHQYEIWIKYNDHYSRKSIWTCGLQKCRPLCSGLSMLKISVGMPRTKSSVTLTVSWRIYRMTYNYYATYVNWMFPVFVLCKR